MLSEKNEAFEKKGVTSLKLVSFEYSELIDQKNDLSERIERAYGPDGLGLCIVKGIPNYAKLRAELLPLSQRLVNLPQEKLEKLMSPESNYDRGWNPCKESFKGKLDSMKASFNGGPQLDERVPKRDGEEFKPEKFWPEDLPELKTSFKALGQCILDTAAELAFHIDRYVESKLPTYEKGKLSRVIRESDNSVGRLLHYYPAESEKAEEGEMWCGAHTDMSTLTGLCGAMYLDKDGNIADFVDEQSGLQVLGRDQLEYKVSIPKDSLAFQLGDTQQIYSGGLLMSTPHYVKIGKKIANTGLSRNTFVVFIEPRRSEPMIQPSGIEKKQVVGKEEFKGLVSLGERWIENQPFQDFYLRTLATFRSGV